jgi:hypothetical protein
MVQWEPRNGNPSGCRELSGPAAAVQDSIEKARIAMEFSTCRTGFEPLGRVRGEANASAWIAENLANLLEVSPKTFYKLANFECIPVIRIGGMLRFDPVQTASWLRARTTGLAMRKAA